MENKRKLLRKLNNIKAGKLDLDEYIEEVKAKIEAESQGLSQSCVSGSACSCASQTDRWNCEKECVNKPKIIQS